MAYNPYDLARVQRPKPTQPAGGRYALSRPAPLTQNAQLADDQNLQGLQTGKFADVQSAANATQRANALRTSQSLQAARGTAARAGDLSPEAALRAQDQALASAGAQNLNADNAVNQLQRQYRQDAVNRAGEIEGRATTAANNERAYQTDADRYDTDQAWKGYEADVGEESRLFGQNFQLGEQARQQGNTDRDYGEGVRRYDLGRADQQGTQAEDTRRFDLQYGANREDRAADVGFRDKQYGDSRDDVAYNRTEDRNRFDLTRNDANSQFDQTFGANRSDRAEDVGFRNQQYGDSRADVADDKAFRNQSYGDSRKDTAFSQGMQTQQFGANREDAAFSQGLARDQFGASREDAADNRSRFDLSRADANSQFSQQFGANREDAAFSQGLARDQFGASRQDAAFNQGLAKDQFGAQREDAATAKDQFSQQFGANRQDAAFNQGLARDQFGANREDAATQRDQFGATLADSRSRFDLSRQDANSQFDQTFGANREDAAFNQQYQLSRDQVGDQRYDQQYGDQRADIGYDRENANRLEGKGDELAMINSIQDPKAKQAAYNAYMRGEDVSKFITGSLYDENGGLRGGADSPYASASPGEQSYQAKIDELRSYYPNKSESEIQNMAEQERSQDRTLSRAPADAATKEQQIQAILEKDRLGQPLTPDEQTLAIASGAYKEYTPTSIPKGSNATALAGKKVSIGGQVYTVVAGSRYITEQGGTFSSDRHEDYTIIKDAAGATKYVVGGKITSSKPKDNNSPPMGMF